MDLSFAHLEDITKFGIQKTAIPPGASHTSFRNHHVAFFRHAGDGDGGLSGESLILDLFVEGLFAPDIKRPGDPPVNVVCQSIQNRRVI